MKRGFPLLLSLFSGIMLWFSWYPHGYCFLIFIAFVPLLWVSDNLLTNKRGGCFWKGIYLSFPAFLIWNVGTTWWIWNSTPQGSIVAMALNSFFMSCVFGVWHWTKKTEFPKMASSLTFIAFWCAWEFLHLNWQITWPWLNLGNVFATNPAIVQWYEYTGTFGGTIWILVVNFLSYTFIQTLLSGIRKIGSNSKSYFGLTGFMSVLPRKIDPYTSKMLIVIALAIITPILISFAIYKTYKINQETPIEVVIVQQNIDPWKEQYQKSNFDLAKLLIQNALPKITPRTVLTVCSESAIPHTIYEEQLYHLDSHPHPVFLLFDTLFQHFPNLNIIFGVSTSAQFDSKVTVATRQFSNGNFVEFYNSSCIYNKDRIELYRKSKLVPGVEKMPYPNFFWFLEKLAIDLGGISGSLGIDSKQRAFTVSTEDKIIKVGAPICYESIFGELFSQFVKNGAQIMCVITNDAWWGNTSGYKQHFEMSALRAIETRKYVIRAANTGISAFFDPLGKPWQKTKYEVRTAISQTVFTNNKITFYTKHGDYLARIMLGTSALIVIIVFLKKIMIFANRKMRPCSD